MAKQHKLIKHHHQNMQRQKTNKSNRTKAGETYKQTLQVSLKQHVQKQSNESTNLYKTCSSARSNTVQNKHNKTNTFNKSKT